MTQRHPWQLSGALALSLSQTSNEHSVLSRYSVTAGAVFVATVARAMRNTATRRIQTRQQEHRSHTFVSDRGNCKVTASQYGGGGSS